MAEFYFSRFEDRRPPPRPAPPAAVMFLWQVAASAAAALGARYLWWRWSASLNTEALWFALPVAVAETMAYVGLLLFFYNLWDERPLRWRPPPADRAGAGLPGAGPIEVDILITTYDEDPELVRLSIRDARRVRVPPGVRCRVLVLDDGNRAQMARVAAEEGAAWIGRADNRGFKAGNLRNGLAHSSGDFVVICDADTRLYPGFLEATLGYFRDPKVAWVQTPHWFYDLPPGRALGTLLARLGRPGRALAARLPASLRRAEIGADPFGNDPALFFDVIQRRRNRAFASFCCGAGSIHRREAVLGEALADLAARAGRIRRRIGPATARRWARRHGLRPFLFHVSEDIYTSIRLHASPRRWRSVLHPRIEARMLSPWDMRAWATQRHKYAGGSLDILLHDRRARRGLPLPHRLFYASTFWSYVNTLGTLVLLVAPAVALATGISPVRAYSAEFFAQLIPFLLMNELALVLGTWGHDSFTGRRLSISVFWINLRALAQVLARRPIRFPATPKLPGARRDLREVRPHLALIAALAAALALALARRASGPALAAEDAALVVNGFWALSNIYMLAHAPRAALWRPAELESAPRAPARTAHRPHTTPLPAPQPVAPVEGVQAA